MHSILSVVASCFSARTHHIKDALLFAGFVEAFIHGWSEVGSNLVDERQNEALFP